MKNIIICFASLTALLLLCIWGCKKEPNLSPKPELIAPSIQAASDRSGDGFTVIGPKHTNPYKVDIIKQAYNNLYEPDISSLSPNYIYVRFLPQSPQDVKKLLDSRLELWDFPLDNEIISFGERYHDPAVTDSTYTWQYAVVEVGSTMPAVQYEVLEQLALVPEDCAIAQEAFLLTGNDYQAPEQFEPAPSLVGGKFQFLLDNGNPSDGGGSGTSGGPEGSDCNCPIPDHQRKPSGCVQVFDNMLSGWEGVIHVDVITSKSQIFGAIFQRKTETDNNGCWMINHKYNGKIHVWVRWENSTCDIKTMEGNADLWGYSFSRRAHIGSFWGPNYNNLPIKFNFTNAINSFDFRNWVASSVNNAVFEYGGFVASQGISGSLPGDLQILTTPWGSDNTGAAPMLDKLGFIQQIILFGSANALLRGVFNVVGLVFPVQIAEWLEVFAPDISLNLNDSGEVNSDDIRELIYHELSHAMHFNKVGSNYWLANIAYTVLHLGYGDGTAAGAGRCSVIESWGFMVGIISTHLRYGSNNSNTGNPLTNTWRRRLERDFAWIVPPGGTPHIPFAWEWDIQDDNLTNPGNEEENATVSAVGDRVLNITNAQIFSTMTSSMQSIPQMKTALVPFLPPSVSLSTYNILCSAYGF